MDNVATFLRSAGKRAVELMGLNVNITANGHSIRFGDGVFRFALNVYRLDGGWYRIADPLTDKAIAKFKSDNRSAVLRCAKSLASYLSTTYQ